MTPNQHARLKRFIVQSYRVTIQQGVGHDLLLEVQKTEQSDNEYFRLYHQGVAEPISSEMFTEEEQIVREDTRA